MNTSQPLILEVRGPSNSGKSTVLAICFRALYSEGLVTRADLEGVDEHFPTFVQKGWPANLNQYRDGSGNTFPRIIVRETHIPISSSDINKDIMTTSDNITGGDSAATATTTTEPAAPAAYEPNPAALVGAFKTDDFSALVSNEGEHRLLAIPCGSEHFANVVENTDALAALDAHFEHMGIRPAKALLGFRKIPRSNNTPVGGQALPQAGWLVAIKPINDLKTYLLKLDKLRLFRITVFCQSAAFDHAMNPMGSFVVSASEDGKKVLGVIDGFDSKVQPYESSTFVRTMVLANLLQMLHTARQRVDPGLGRIQITGCEGPGGNCWITDVRVAMSHIGGESPDVTRRVVKMLETKNGGALDVYFFTLDENDQVLDVHHFDSLLPYVHDAVAGLMHAFLSKAAPVDELYARMEEARVLPATQQAG